MELWASVMKFRHKILYTWSENGSFICLIIPSECMKTLQPSRRIPEINCQRTKPIERNGMYSATFTLKSFAYKSPKAQIKTAILIVNQKGPKIDLLYLWRISFQPSRPHKSYILIPYFRSAIVCSIKLLELSICRFCVFKIHLLNVVFSLHIIKLLPKKRRRLIGL